MNFIKKLFTKKKSRKELENEIEELKSEMQSVIRGARKAKAIDIQKRLKTLACKLVLKKKKYKREEVIDIMNNFSIDLTSEIWRILEEEKKNA